MDTKEKSRETSRTQKPQEERKRKAPAKKPAKGIAALLKKQPAAKPAAPVSANANNANAPIANKQEIVAAVCAVIAEELGTDASFVRE